MKKLNKLGVVLLASGLLLTACLVIQVILAHLAHLAQNSQLVSKNN